MTKVKSRDEAMEAVIDIVSRQAFAKLGWDYDKEVDVSDPSEDVRLIKAAAPAFVDVTIEEVLKAFKAQEDAVMGEEDPSAHYVRSNQQRVIASDGRWHRLEEEFTPDEAYRVRKTWEADGRFETRRSVRVVGRRSYDTVYVRARKNVV